MPPMTPLDRFLAMMEYRSVDRTPNWELGIWPQTAEVWKAQGCPVERYHWDWFPGEAAMGMDPKEFIPFKGATLPPFEEKTLEEDAQTILFQDSFGRVRRALKTGTVGSVRMSMDTYLRFAVNTPADWPAVKGRFTAGLNRLDPAWAENVPRWQKRSVPLIFGPNCSTVGFYWWARDLMGTEGLSYAWYDMPDLMHEMMEFWGDFLIESIRPVLAQTTVDYITLNEDLAMKTGPLLSPETYRAFILPHLKRVVAFCKTHGLRYFAIDSDGNPEPIVPMLMEAGVDILWPQERAAEQDPVRLRRKFGKTLRLWGGVDKRELAKGPATIRTHLQQLRPLVEEGGFVPTVDHTVPPDVSWANFQCYLEEKEKLLAG